MSDNNGAAEMNEKSKKLPMTDSELMPYAMSAAGEEFVSECISTEGAFDPRQFDRQAFKLATLLRITVGADPRYLAPYSLAFAKWNFGNSSLSEYGGGDIYVAARRAVFRAAAYIGIDAASGKTYEDMQHLPPSVSKIVAVQWTHPDDSGAE